MDENIESQAKESGADSPAEDSTSPLALGLMHLHHVDE